MTWEDVMSIKKKSKKMFETAGDNERKGGAIADVGICPHHEDY